MRILKYIVVITVTTGVLFITSGCGSLSLFSSRHVHYHASPEADKKIETLEKRVDALEKATQDKK